MYPQILCTPFFFLRSRSGDSQGGQRRFAGRRFGQGRRGVRSVVDIDVQEHDHQVQAGRRVRAGDAGRQEGEVGHQRRREHPPRGPDRSGERQEDHHRQDVHRRRGQNGKISACLCCWLVVRTMTSCRAVETKGDVVVAQTVACLQ